MIQSNMVSSIRKEYMSLGTGEVDSKPNQTTNNLSSFPNPWSYIFLPFPNFRGELRSSQGEIPTLREASILYTRTRKLSENQPTLNRNR